MVRRILDGERSICNGPKPVPRTKDLIHSKQRHQECHEETFAHRSGLLQHFKPCPSTVETDLNIQLFLHELTNSRSFAIELVPMTQLTFRY